MLFRSNGSTNQNFIYCCTSLITSVVLVRLLFLRQRDSSRSTPISVDKVYIQIEWRLLAILAVHLLIAVAYDIEPLSSFEIRASSTCLFHVLVAEAALSRKSFSLKFDEACLILMYAPYSRSLMRSQTTTSRE